MRRKRGFALLLDVIMAASLASIMLITITAIMFNRTSITSYVGSQTSTDAAMDGVQSAITTIKANKTATPCQFTGENTSSMDDTGKWYVRIIGYNADPTTTATATATACSSSSGTISTSAARYWVITSTGVSSTASKRGITAIWDSQDATIPIKYTPTGNYGIQSTDIPQSSSH